MISKKFKFYIFLFLCLLIIFEIISAGLIYFINQHPLIKKSKEFYESTKITNELNEYVDLIPYIDYEFNKELKFENQNLNERLFKVYNKFSNKNFENILLQGDSWAEAANKELIRKNIEILVKKKNFGFINAGKKSYSVSPMNVQYDILYKKFNIKPSIIIAIIDQTDIGDEIHRYQNLRNDNLELTDTGLSVEFKKNFFILLESKKFNLIKFMLILKEFWTSKFYQFNENYLETLKYIIKRISYVFYKIPAVLSPLKFGLSETDEKIIQKRYHRYFENIFENGLKKLILVVHPHRDHIFNNNYKYNLEELVEDVVNNSIYKSKISMINFSENFNSIYKDYAREEIFIEEDVFSHLTDNAYRDIYFPIIMKNCCN